MQQRAQPRRETATPADSSTAKLFAQGFSAMLPLWTAAIPVGIVYGVAARAAGLGAAETQLMSVLVFSSAAQLSAVSLLEAGAPAFVLVTTAVALNAQLLLLGLAAGRQLRSSTLGRLAAGWLLTDASFAISAARGRLRLAVLLGAGASMYLGWNLGTALGALAGDALPDPRRLGIDIVPTLAFLAVLVPLMRSRAAVGVALIAGACALLISRIAPVGVAVLGAGLAGGATGAWLTRRGRTGGGEEREA